MASNTLPEGFATTLAYDGTRTPVKSALFVLVCLAWLLPGLVGHDPWKSDEAIVFGIVHDILGTREWILLTLAGEPVVDRAPLYPWIAAASARAFGGGWIAVHDAARLATGLFMALTLAFVALASRELMGERAMRLSVLLFIGCLGLLIRAHEMSTDLAGVTGIALALYGLALAARRPHVGGAVTGLGAGLGFLGDGMLPLALVAILMLALPLAGSAWRTRRYAATAAYAFAAAAPLVALWPALLFIASPSAAAEWLSRLFASRWTGSTRGGILDFVYFAKTLPWYAWPAWPLAAWSVWRARQSLATRADLLLPFVATVVFFVGLSLFADAREANTMPLLLPLALLGVAEIDTLRRGAASALDWFGVTTFFLLAAAIWLGWVAALTGSPEPVAAWIAREVPGFRYPFRFIPFALAALLTLIWLVVVARSLRTTRRALVNWTAGITMVWMLAMTLGLPLVDQARSYRGVAQELATRIPVGYQCALARDVGEAQRALLYQFASVRFMRPEHSGASRCRVLVVQAHPSRIPPAEAGWSEVWRGSRPGDKSELLLLYRR